MKHIKLRECPFCGGPPVAFASPEFDEFGRVEDMCAHVFCNECNAQGPSLETMFCGLEPIREIMLEAAANAWNGSDARNAGLYNPDRATLSLPDEGASARQGIGDV